MLSTVGHEKRFITLGSGGRKAQDRFSHDKAEMNKALSN